MHLAQYYPALSRNEHLYKEWDAFPGSHQIKIHLERERSHPPEKCQNAEQIYTSSPLHVYVITENKSLKKPYTYKR